MYASPFDQSSCALCRGRHRVWVWVGDCNIKLSLDPSRLRLPHSRDHGDPRNDGRYLADDAAFCRYLFDAHDLAHLGEVELVRYRALEAMLKNPNLASPDPARAAHMPKDQAEFLAAYHARLQEIVDFLRAHRLVTIPSYIGAFQIRLLPEAFKPTSPGGFMNPPGLYDNDPTGFYYIPTYNPTSGNFYIRAAIEDPRPILGHEGIPGHFLQISIANHLPDEIRRQHADTVFEEGWALYGEEMLLREGLYPDESAAEGQVLRLSRYRAARIGVDVNLHTGRWNFEQAASTAKPPKVRRPERPQALHKRSPTLPASGRSCVCSAAIATARAQTFASAPSTIS